MKFTSQRRLDCDVLEREFTLGDIHGCLWTPPSSPAPLILLGHPGGLGKMYPRLVGRAQRSAADGFAAATIELPEQPPSDGADQLRAELRRAIQAGQRPTDDTVERLVFPLVEHAVPAWQRTLDALLALPDVSGPVGFAGGSSPSASGWPSSNRASRPSGSSPAAGCRGRCSTRHGG